MQFHYDTAHQSEISFPLGGIGTGCIGLAGNGRLVDWEIYNRPSKGSENGYTHFAVKCTRDGKLLDARLLQGDLTGSLQGSFTRTIWQGAFGWGPAQESMAGYPHFAQLDFEGRYPFATLRFADETFPGNAQLRAFNPFIPLDADNSSLPAAFFEITLENTNDFDADYTVAFTLRNPFDSMTRLAQGGIYFDSKQEKNSVKYGNMTVLTDARDVDLQEQWFRGAWNDAQTVYWRQFTQEQRLPARRYEDGGRNGDHATLAAHARIPAGASKRFRFLLSWSSPNCENYWSPPPEGEPNAWKNYYATQFASSLESAVYALQSWDSLQARTERFAEILQHSSLPPAALEALVSNLAILKSPTVRRLEDGALWGFEGVSATSGICPGSCTHVWNYAYAFAFLFPALERSMRSLDYKYNLCADGRMPFRLQLPLTRNLGGDHGGGACADGQLGGVIKTYRDWKISGDDAWLRSIWPAVKASLEFAWNERNRDCWDRDKDGVLEGRQHHTLDMELFGPNSWLTGFYLGALKAGAEMAEYLGETENAVAWRRLFENGKTFCDEKLFNGEYYCQLVDLKDRAQLDRYNGYGRHECNGSNIYASYWNEEAQELKYQIADGCEIQQVMAQWHANLCGLGELFDPAQVKTALRSLFRYNFVPQMRKIANFWRNYCLDDEGGLLIATWPAGKYRPAVPLPYETETQNGYEYQALIHMIQAGLAEEGLRGIAAIRARYDGAKRNPWNEFECGGNYARSMASYALLPTFSGFQYDMVRGHIGFAPADAPELPPVRRFFWSLDCAWGEVVLAEDFAELTVAEGTLTLRSFAFHTQTLRFPEAITLRSEETKRFDFPRVCAKKENKQEGQQCGETI
ncbi:MAG: hypothetical protein LBC83_01955 [Oscillospiraceae bacterium]|jgi:uncharacterized protein (DUF608 family)|nr:hypothetical protein [Oscillospiraceae bacterium]